MLGVLELCACIAVFVQKVECFAGILGPLNHKLIVYIFFLQDMHVQSLGRRKKFEGAGRGCLFKFVCSHVVCRSLGHQLQSWTKPIHNYCFVCQTSCCITLRTCHFHQVP